MVCLQQFDNHKGLVQITYSNIMKKFKKKRETGDTYIAKDKCDIN